MPRKRTVADTDLLDAALAVVRATGPDSLTFGALSPRVGLAASTIVQRYGSKAGLLHAALSRAWDLLEEETAAAVDDTEGVVDLLVRLSGQYGVDDDFADQLLLLREDLRDPVLRARGVAWLQGLADVVDQRLEAGMGRLVVPHWQGTLTVWSFTRSGTLPDAVRAALGELLDRSVSSGRRPG